MTTARAATSTTYVGPAAPTDWANAAYWDNGVPINKDWQAVIPVAVDFSGAANIPTTLNRLTTGTGRVVIPGGMTLSAATGYVPSSGLTVGSGGLEFSGTVTITNGGWAFVANGDFKAANLYMNDNQGTVTQTSGRFSIAGTITLPINSAPFNIGAWQFAAGPATISANASSSWYRFTGTPTFLAGQRTNWTMSSYMDAPGPKWDLNGQGLWGNDLTVTAAGSGTNPRAAYLYNRVAGAWIDANTVTVNPSYPFSYLDLQNATLTVRGGGTAWNNGSTNNTAFDLTTNTTTVLDPDAGALSVHTGSQDNGAAGAASNFAFNHVRIGAGDTVTLTGNANIGGGAMAMYVTGDLRGGNGSTLALGGRNLYVDGNIAPGNSIGTFTVSGGSGTAGVDLSLGGLTIEFGTGGADRLDVPGGLLTLGGTASLTLTDLGTALIDPINGDTFIIATYGTRSGDFGSVLGPAAFTFDLQYDMGAGSNEIWLTVIPEPGAALLLLGAAATLAARRRRSPR